MNLYTVLIKPVEIGDDMSKEYVFEFQGTMEAFLSNLNRFSHNTTHSGGTIYFLNDYIVEIMDEEIRFGVARGGHSGGYWFIPTITNFDDKIEFRGTIRYIGSGSGKRGIIKNAIEGIEIFLLLLLILPIALVIRVYWFIEWLARKMINRPKPKEKTNEERLIDLMVNYGGCAGK